ncbi:MAG: DUF3107 domain-containing protein [Actinomycetota bacterium]
MEIRIGVSHSARDLSLELESDDKSRAAARQAVEEALAGTTEVLWLNDQGGREVAGPAERCAWVEVGARAGAPRADSPD